jgi:glycerol-3-phosphate acyltransferase PlsX
MFKIGLDVSGGDKAPEEVVKGAILAKKELKANVVLVGVRTEIERELVKNGSSVNDFEIVEASEKIEMCEAPAVSVRRKRKSSIVVGCNLLRDKKIDAFVSCGNTGAVVCAATISLGLMDGVERPGIGLAMPNKKGVSLVIDVGANVDPKPLHLFQYGIMASVYYELVFGKVNPTVGLLNIGEEDCKGTDFMKMVHKMFTASPLNFTGNLEAKQLFSGDCDCIVADGFAGNIALKVAESCADFIGRSLLGFMKKDILGMVGLVFAQGSFKKFKKMINYAEYGGAPLLGVNGVVIIAHGSSNALAVKNAIRVAAHELERDLIPSIQKRVTEICQHQDLKEILAGIGG